MTNISSTTSHPKVGSRRWTIFAYATERLTITTENRKNGAMTWICLDCHDLACRPRLGFWYYFVQTLVWTQFVFNSTLCRSHTEQQPFLQLKRSASEMTYIVSSGALNSTHSLTAKTSTYITSWTLPPWPIVSNIGAWGQLWDWITVASIDISHVTPSFGLLQSLTGYVRDLTIFSRNKLTIACRLVARFWLGLRLGLYLCLVG